MSQTSPFDRIESIQSFHIVGDYCYIYTQLLCNMGWTKESLKESRVKAKMSQKALADTLGVHWRTIQNWEKGAVIPQASVLALDRVFGEMQDYVSREEYNKVVAALDSATELNKKLTDIIQSASHPLGNR